MVPSTDAMGYFYPRPPRGGRRVARSFSASASAFLSTPSARRATVVSGQVELGGEISIHALREEGDTDADGHQVTVVEFLSTPSARRATQAGPAGLRRHAISIHALREEGDPGHMAQRRLLGISIHALREEGD